MLSNSLKYDPLFDDSEKQQSFLGQLGSTALGGLSRVANVFGVPGAMVQNALALENPLTPLLHPTTSEGRVGGRGLLRKYGLIGQEDTTPNWFAGFAADVLTDPFTFAGPGALAKAAGSGVKGLGAASRVADAAQAGGGLLRVGVPGIASTTREVLTGPGSLGAADSLRKAAEYLGTSYPMRTALTALDSSKMGRTTAEGQRIGAEVFDSQGVGQQQVKALTTDIARSLEKTGRTTPAAGAALRSEIEIAKKAGAPVSDEANKLADMFSTYKTQSEHVGLKSNDLEDSIGYAMRQLNENLIDTPSSDKLFGPFGGKSSKDVARNQLLKGFTEGTEGVNKLFADQGLKGKVNSWSQQIEAARTGGAAPPALNALKKQAIADLEQHIGQQHGQTILQQFQPVNDKGKKLWQDVSGKNIWSKTAPQGATAVMQDRHKGLAAMALDSGKWFEHTPFPNNPVVDAEVYALSHENRIRAASTIYENIAKMAQPGSAMPKDASTTLGTMFKGLGLNSKTASQRIADQMGTPWSKQAGMDILSMRVPKELASDLMSAWPTYQVPKNTGLLLNSLDSMQGLWKASMLTWPATIVRNATSGAIQNTMKGWLDIGSFVDAHKLAQGQTVKNLTGIREIRDWIANHNLPITDENATEALRQIYASHHTGHNATDVVSAAMPNVDPGIEAMLARVPGRTPTTAKESIAKVAATAVGQAPDTNLNPLNVRGVSGRTKSTFGPAAAADMTNEYVDTLNRAAPLIYRMRQGHPASQAMKEITEAQVDYSGRAFTTEERSILKRAFPFYSFTKSQLYWVAKELLQNPGGRLRNTIRATDLARGNDPSTPDYVAETAAIPLGQTEDGTKRFVTGFGLMHEDPLSFFGSPKEAMLETLSRSNPLLKGSLEFATGQSFFQRGPDGGRPMNELDPVIGRTLANIGNLTGLRESTDPVRYPGAGFIEQVASNSPLSRVLTTARTLTDTRKDPLTKAANLLSGVRIADISPGAQDRATLEKVTQALKAGGARTFSSTSIPADRLAAMSPAERDLAEKLIELKKTIAKRGRARKKNALELAAAQ
jgi:hypothetical protein